MAEFIDGENVEVDGGGGGEAGPVEAGEARVAVAKGRRKVYENHGARQLAYRARQRIKGLHMVWVSLEHLAVVRAMVKAEKEAAEAVVGVVAKPKKVKVKKIVIEVGDAA